MNIFRAYDGSQEWVKFTPSPPGGPTGKYQFVANQTFVLYPQLATTRPFLVKSVKEFDKYGGPYAIPSAKYNAEYDELATVGNANSSKQTAFFKETAKFWEGGASTNFVLSAHFPCNFDCGRSLAVSNPKGDHSLLPEFNGLNSLT